MSVDILPLLPKNSKQINNNYIIKGHKNRQIKQNLAKLNDTFQTILFTENKIKRVSAISKIANSNYIYLLILC